MMEIKMKVRPTLTLRRPGDPDKPETIQDMLVEIRYRRTQIEQVKERIVAASPIKVGDTVEINDGGSFGKLMRVNELSVEEDESGSWILTAVGAALTVDGKPGSRRGIHRMELVELAEDQAA